MSRKYVELGLFTKHFSRLCVQNQKNHDVYVYELVLSSNGDYPNKNIRLCLYEKWSRFRSTLDQCCCCGGGGGGVDIGGGGPGDYRTIVMFSFHNLIANNRGMHSS